MPKKFDVPSIFFNTFRSSGRSGFIFLDWQKYKKNKSEIIALEVYKILFSANLKL